PARQSFCPGGRRVGWRAAARRDRIIWTAVTWRRRVAIALGGALAIGIAHGSRRGADGARTRSGERRACHPVSASHLVGSAEAAGYGCCGLERAAGGPTSEPGGAGC